jgi:hypothetical protein
LRRFSNDLTLFLYAVIISHLKRPVPLLTKFNSLHPRKIVSILAEIGPLVLEKFIKNFQYIFTCVPRHLNKLETPFLKDDLLPSVALTGPVVLEKSKM